VLGVLARRLAGDRVGLLAAGLAAVSPALWMNDSVIGLETLYGFLVAMSLLTFYKFWNDRRLRWALLLAVWLALAALTRSEGVILVVFIAVPTVLFLPDIDWRRRVGILAAMAAVVMVVMAPWVIRNLTTFEEPTTLGTGFGVVLAYSNCDATYSGPHLGYWDDGCALRGYVPGSDESVFDARAREKGVTYLRDHVERLPIVVAARIGRVWEVFRPFQNVELNAFFERRGTAASWAGLISYWLLLPCAIGGLVALRRRRIPIFPYLAIAASVTVTVATSFGITRYRAPVDVVLPLLAAVAIDALLRHRQRVDTRDERDEHDLHTLDA
jgi:4-amino-4-deoxy-L-arabinose transferase-like glycosyltransferase